MKYRLVVGQLGLLLVVLSGIMLVIAAWAVFDWWTTGVAPEGAEALLGSAGGGLLLGGALWLVGRRAPVENLGRREALLLVALSWLLGAAVAAFPFLLWAFTSPTAAADHPFRNYVDCYFEAMSGLTTTGASVLTDIEALPRGILLWRSTTHWLGGLGIVVLFVAVLPGLGVGAKKVYQMEAPGPTKAGVRPRIAETARVLWVMYTGLTLAEIIALRLCGMDWFNAVCHTFGTVATGGFSTLNASIGGYNSTAVNVVIIIFMLLAAVNFGLYYRLIRGDARNVWQDTELRFFIIFLTLMSTIIVVSVWQSPHPIYLTTGEELDSNLRHSIEQGVFTAVSIQTTTGYGTADFDRWPFIAKAALILMMFMGGSAGSTAGGIKAIRVWLAIKILVAEIEKVFHPYHIRPVRIGGSAIDAELRMSVMSFCFGMVLLFAVGSVAIMVFEAGACDYETAATAAIASLFSIGPGLAKVGPVLNYGWMTEGSKLVCSLLMVLGRLEVFAIFVLLLPRFWRER